MEKCYFCKGNIIKENVTIDFWWGDKLFVIEKVPAEVCKQCGERYFDSEVSKGFDRIVKSKEKIKKSINVPVIEYLSA